MTRSIPIAVPTWTVKQVEIPDKCPKCGASFLEGSLLQQISLESVLFSGHIHIGDQEFYTDGDNESCLEFTAVGYQCACRGWDVP
jgi:Zn-finger nucleic acid-binding protein